jgi:solute carrier family 8 (sodium/calcium exchanger)
LWDGEG